MFKNKSIATFFVAFLILMSLLMICSVSAQENNLLENQTDDIDLESSEIEVDSDVLSVAATQEPPAELGVESQDVLEDADRTIYVNPTATSPYDGSREHPYYSISSALSNVVSGQSTEIVLMDGTYSGSSNNYLTFSKSDVTVRADEGAHPVISFTQSSTSYNSWKVTASNVAFDGITFTNTLTSQYYSTGMISVDSSSVYNLNITNCNFECTRNSRPVFVRYAHNVLIENNTMTGYNDNSNQAMGIYNAYDVVVRNNTVDGFIGSTSSNSGGSAVQTQYVTNVIIENNTFMNVKGANGGAIYQYGSSDSYPAIIRYNRIINASSRVYGGGAIYLSGNRNQVYNNTIINCSAKTSGGAIYVYGYNNYINNNSMYNCSAPTNGGGVYITTTNSNYMNFEGNKFVNCSAVNGGGFYSYCSMNINNNSFINCSARDYGGGAYFYQEYTTARYLNLTDSSFTGNEAGIEGGAIYSTFANPTISNTEFENNTADYGGALSFFNRFTYTSGNYNVFAELYNNTFKNNTAENGGAVYSHRFGSALIDNNTFIANNATLGGAIFTDYPRASYEASTNVIVNRSYFENNTAYSGAAVILYSSNSIVENSTFINNNATRYGGALISGGKGNKIVNNTFLNNTAKLYAGAIGTNDSYILNNTFENNTAYQAGAILTTNSTITNNSFLNNNATRGKDIVYIDTYKYYTSKVICNCTNCTDCNCQEGECNCENAAMQTVVTDLLENNNLEKENVYTYNETELLRVAKEQYGKYYLYNDPKITSGDYYYWAYCIEQNNSIPLGYNGTDGIKVNDLEFVRNSLDQSYVGDYIKVLLIMYQDEIYNLKDYVYVFTDGDYLNSDDPIIKNVINVTNDEATYLKNGLNIVNGSFSCYWFSTFINPTSRQNLILINACKPIEYAGFTPTKTPNVSIASPNSDVTYTVTILNDHDIVLNNVSVTEKLGSGDWYISGWQNTLNDAWERTGENTWVLHRSLAPGEMAKFNVICHVGSNNNGNYLSNTIDVFTRETGYQSTTSTIPTKTASIKVEKIALNRYVAPGELANFKIVVTNNGPTTVSNIRVDDVSQISQLDYVGWSNDVGTWSNNGWSSSSSQKTIQYYLSGSLAPGQSASFFVYFKVPSTATYYSATNNANLFVNSNQQGSSYDTVYIQRPSLSITKVTAYGSQTTVGNTITFKVTVNSYGSSNSVIRNVYVEDVIPEGLVYQSWSGTGWTYAAQYGNVVEKPRWTYDAPLVGYSTTNPLYITCKATQLGDGVNTATVYADGQTPKSASANYYVVGPSVQIQKTPNATSVYQDDQVAFTMKVTNNGVVALNDVTVFDSYHPDLEYVSFSDPSGKWIKGSGLIWKYNGTLSPSQSSTFDVIFKALQTGTAHNVASVTTKEGPTDESSTSVNVLPKEIIGSKTTTDKVVENGSTVSFTVNVRNNCGSTLHDVYVDELPDEGLTYTDWSPIRGSWTYDDQNKRYTLASLSSGDYASFKVNYKAEKIGTLTNTIHYSASELTKVYSSSDDTFVRSPQMTIEKVALKDIVYLGDEVGFMVRVNNTGNVVLNHVYVNETSFEGLQFTRWENLSGYWRIIENADGTYSFKLYGNLAENASASFLVFFSTNIEGCYTNIVKGGSDQTPEKEANDTISVEKCLLEIEKITKTEIVPLYDNATFTINVTNIGGQTLTDVYVKEMYYDGLEYQDFKPVKGDWQYEDGVFKLKSELLADDWAAFDIIFKTTKVGNLTNVVQGTYKGSRNVTANNTTSVIHPNMTLEKITLNKTVNINDNVTFTIVVKNNGYYDLSDVAVIEREYDGLTNPKFVSNVGNWIYENGEYRLMDILKVGKSASFNITFTANKYGNLTNIVAAHSNLTHEIIANNTTFVRNPNLTVVKLALNESVSIYDTAVFQIIVNNTGNVDLDDIFVNETSHVGLDYLEFEKVRGEWEFEGGLFKLNGKLVPGDHASFNVIFIANQPGNLTNTVEAGSNETENKTASNKTFAKRPDLEVQKLALNKTVKLGENVTFTIVVNNTGNIKLTNVTVEEYLHAGLKFESYAPVKGDWLCDGETFTLNGELNADDWASFNITFSTTASGNLTNIIIAKSNETNQKEANNTTFAQDYSFIVEKITDTKIVKINENATFTIVVTNIGNMDLKDVFVEETSFDGLEFLGFAKIKGEWEYDNNKFKLNSLAIGENASFNVTFKAVKPGNLTNVITAGANDTDNKIANNTTYVLNPKLSVEKITVNKTVIIGENVIFTIIVRNTGNVDLTDVYVKETEHDGLYYLTFVNNCDKDWSYSTLNSIFRLFGTLKVGENASFNVTFKTTKTGLLNNTVEAFSNESDSKVANNTTFVKDPKLSVVKISLNESVKLGEKAYYQIVVTNIGNCELTDVFVRELDNPALEYDGEYVSDVGTWTYDNGLFMLAEPLAIGESASFNVSFITKVINNVTNIVVAGSSEANETKANNTTFVGEPDLSVIKITVNETVKIGEDVTFTIVVTNNGNIDLTEVFVHELNYTGLINPTFVSNKGSWTNEGDLYKLLDVLKVGEDASFNITFTANTSGVVKNTVRAGSSEADNKTANNTTFVENPELDVRKITVNKTVIIGEDVTFNIVVTNIGNVELTEVSVKETEFDGLEYLGYDEVIGEWSYRKATNNFILLTPLAVGENASFNVTFKANKIGLLNNTVVASSKESEDKSANNTTFVRNPVLDIVKLTVNKTVYNNDEVIFTIVVTNNGNCVLGDVVVQEYSFDGLEYQRYVNKTGNWKYENGNTFRLVGNLEIGANATFDVVFKAVKTGNLTNIVLANSNDTKGDKANNTTEVNPICDVEIIKLVDGRIHYLDENITWTIIVTNNGPDDALNVNVSDILPKTLRLLDVNASKGKYASGVWIIGTLKSHETQTLKLITNATKSDISITNTAIVNTTTPESNTNNNKANNTTEIKQKVSLEIQKTVSNSTPRYGDVITWTVTVTNNGPDVAENVVITDELPDGLVLVSGSLVNDVGSLAPGESVDVSVKTLVNATGSIVNVAVVDTTSNNTGENRTNETVDVPSEVKLVITKSVSDSTPKYGDVITWTITVRNDGPDTAENVVITDELPDGLVLVGGSLVNDVGSLAPGESVNVTVKTLVNQTGSIENIATVTTTSNNTGDNETNKTVNVPKEVKLDITKSVSNSTPALGDIVTWTITVRNNGPDTAENVVITDELPDGLVLVEGNLVTEVDSLAPGKSVEVTLKTLVNQTGKLVNVASVVTPNNVGNNETNESIDVPKAVIIDIDVISNSTPKYGKPSNWTVVITNNGNETADNVTLVYEVPDGVIIVNPITDIGTLKPFESVNVTITAIVNTTEPVNIVVKPVSDNITFTPINIPIEVKVPDIKNQTKPVSDLEIKKVANVKKVFVGDYLIWTITVRNNGPDAAKNVVVHEYLPKELKFISYTATKGSYSNGVWKIDSISNGETITLKIKTKVLAIGNITNPVDVSCDSDNNLTNNKANATIIAIKKNDTTPDTNNTPSKAPKQQQNNIKVEADERQTANPIAILLLALVSIVAVQIKRKE